MLFGNVFKSVVMSLQDELEAAVSARVSRTKPDPFSYSDDFDEEEDGEMA